MSGEYICPCCMLRRAPRSSRMLPRAAPAIMPAAEMLFSTHVWELLLSHSLSCVVGRHNSQMLDNNITYASLACLHGRCVVRGFFDNVGMCISCDYSSLSAALVSVHSGICQGMSWQHLHQPCVAGKV